MVITLIEKLSFFSFPPQMLNVSTFGNTADIYATRVSAYYIRPEPQLLCLLAVNQGNYVRAGFSLKKTSTVSLSIDVRITMIRYVVHLLRIF